MYNIIVFFLLKVMGLCSRIISFLKRKELSDNEIKNSISAKKIIYDDILEIRPLRLETSDSVKSRVILLVPSLSSGGFFGGVATALIFAAKFSLYNKRDLVIIQTLHGGYAGGLDEFFSRNSIIISSANYSVLDSSRRDWMSESSDLTINKEDVFICSAWGDATILNEAKLFNKFIYLIQDYESIFYPNSDRLILAESTYFFDSYVPVCNTEIVYSFMANKGYPLFQSHKYWFEPAVSNAATGITVKNSKKNIFIYGRPSVARNLFYLVLSAIKKIFEEKHLVASDWNIYMAGQDNLPDIVIAPDLKIKNLGKMSVEAYISFSKSVDVAVSLMMAPHPNYPTLEFASIGSAVVTTKYESKNDLSVYSRNIFMAEINLDSLMGNILEASNLSFETRIDNLKYNNIRGDWNVALDNLIKNISTLY
jgi:hypothetical protein